MTIVRARYERRPLLISDASATRTAGAMTTQVFVFGSLRVVVDGRRLSARDFGGRKPKQLLEILVLNSGRYVPKDQLAHLLWGESLPNSASGSLEHYVSLLRRRLAPEHSTGPGVIMTGHGGYRFDPSDSWVDLTQFDLLFEQALAAPDRGTVERALALARDDLLEDEPYACWALTARSAHVQRRLQLHVAAGELALTDGDFGAAAAHARSAVAIDDLHEAGVRLLMTALYRGGEQAEALRVFGRLRRALADDVGADPMPQTAAVHQAVLQHADTSPAARLPTQRGPRNLAGPDESPAAPPLLGRDADVTACVDLVRSSSDGSGLRTALVVGELGMGKSAVLDEVGRRLSPSPVVRVCCTLATRPVQGWLLEELLARALGSLSPVVRKVLDEVAADQLGGRLLGLPALRDLDLLLASVSPFHLLVDDAHLADERSLEVLAALARGRGSSHGMLLLAADVARSPLGHRIRAHPADLTVVLAPLAAEHLLSLGVPGLRERSGGLPLLVAGTAVADGGRRLPSAVVHERVLAALRRDGDAVWAVVVACALAGERFGPEEIARLAGRDVLDVADVQDRLCELHVLDAVEDSYRFRYPMVRDIVRDSVSPARRRLLERHVRAPLQETERRRRTQPPAAGHDRRSGGDRRESSFAIRTPAGFASLRGS